MDHRRYLAFMFELKKKYGSVMDFVRDERVKWVDVEAKGRPFEEPGEFGFAEDCCRLMVGYSLGMLKLSLFR